MNESSRIVPRGELLAYIIPLESISCVPGSVRESIADSRIHADIFDEAGTVSANQAHSLLREASQEASRE